MAMKNILALVGGSDLDDLVLDAAYAAARPLNAHVEFLHIHVGPGEAASWVPHVAFARGAALRDALQWLAERADRSSELARQRVQDFCAKREIAITSAHEGSPR